MNDAADEFEREYFDSGKKLPGAIAYHYRLEDRYPACCALASSIKKYFNAKRLLDLGCGKGFLVKAGREKDIEAWGVDVSEWAISSSPKDITHFLYKIDLSNGSLPFEDDYFDFITFIGTIEYLKDDSLVIREIRRVLKSWGGIYLKTIYKRVKGDKLRVNVHNKDYWIEKFQHAGFQFDPKMSKVLFEDYIEPLFENTPAEPSIKFLFVRFLFKLGGRKILHLLIPVITRYTDSDALLFVKSGPRGARKVTTH